jgi:hypothetical protein
MSAQLRHRVGGGCLLLFFVLAVVGCGSNYNARATVRGQVKFFDKTLTAGTVAFEGSDGRIGSANIDFNGNYEMTDAPIGEVKITVVTPTAARPGAKGNFEAKPPAGMPPMQSPGDVGAGGAAASIDPSKIVSVPGKYAKADTSGLKFTVQPGEQTHNIVLSP